MTEIIVDIDGKQTKLDELHLGMSSNPNLRTIDAYGIAKGVRIVFDITMPKILKKRSRKKK